MPRISDATRSSIRLDILMPKISDATKSATVVLPQDHDEGTELTPTMVPHSLNGLAGVSRGVEISL